MDGHLGAGTQFWIIGKDLSLSHLSDIKSLISGVSIGVDPRPGDKQDEYQGLSQEPVLRYGEQGTTMTLLAEQLGSVQRGTPIYHRGIKVGEVVDYRMTGPEGFDISAFIDDPYTKLVGADTRFWRAGPIHLSTSSGGPSLQFQSIPALVEGAIAFETPGGTPNGPAATPGRRFTLYGSEDAAENAPGTQGIAYRAVFPHASGVPQAEAPVTLSGKRIGSVADSSLRYDPALGRLEVVTTIVLEPRRITLANGAAWSEPRTQMDDMLRHLIAGGLRAELSSSPPVIGSEQVSLLFVPGQPEAALGDGPVPEIPTTGGGGVAGIISEMDEVVAKVNAMPLPRIADNLEDISRSVARLTSSPALAETLRQVDRSTANLQRITRDMERDVPPVLNELRQTVREAQASLASAESLLSARGTAASTPDSETLPQTLHEITRTARALRELSDFLDRNPSAVLVGRRSGP